MCVPATPRPSPTKGAQIAAALLRARLERIALRHVHQADDLGDRHQPPGNASQRLSVLLLSATVGVLPARTFVTVAAPTTPSTSTRYPIEGDRTAGLLRTEERVCTATTPRAIAHRYGPHCCSPPAWVAGWRRSPTRCRSASSP